MVLVTSIKSFWFYHFCHHLINFVLTDFISSMRLVGYFLVDHLKQNTGGEKFIRQ